MSIDQCFVGRSHESPHDSIVNFICHIRKPHSSSLRYQCTIRCILIPSASPSRRRLSTMAATGNAPIVSADNCTLLDSCQRVVDQLWREGGAEIAGDKGYRACQLLSATNSHPEFPIFATSIGSLPSLANGHSLMCICIAGVGCLACVNCRIYQSHTT